VRLIINAMAPSHEVRRSSTIGSSRPFLGPQDCRLPGRYVGGFNPPAIQPVLADLIGSSTSVLRTC
jgi:hypothetical protein